MVYSDDKQLITLGVTVALANMKPGDHIIINGWINRAPEKARRELKSKMKIKIREFRAERRRAKRKYLYDTGQKNRGDVTEWGYRDENTSPSNIAQKD